MKVREGQPTRDERLSTTQLTATGWDYSAACLAMAFKKTTPKCLCFLKCRNDNISKHKRLTDTLTNIYICQHWPPSLPPPPLPDSASPAPPPPRDTERWECGKVIFRTQAESLPEFDALAPDQHSTFEPVRPWGCLCPWWQFFFFKLSPVAQTATGQVYKLSCMCLLSCF